MYRLTQKGSVTVVATYIAGINSMEDSKHQTESNKSLPLTVNITYLANFDAHEDFICKIRHKIHKANELGNPCNPTNISVPGNMHTRTVSKLRERKKKGNQAL